MAGKKMAKQLSVLLILAVFLAAAIFLPLRYPTAAAPGREPAQTAHHYAVLIDLDENTLSLLDSGRPVRQYPCAVGKNKTPSPLGYFHITRKSRWGEGFGGYFLGLNVPWGIYGIHGTTDPGSVGLAASHGCFRLLDEDIRELYGKVGRGTPVLIVSGVYGAFGNGFRMISPGMYGQDVLQMQQRLRRLGYYSGKCNGRYDTADFGLAIRKFQRDHGLPESDSISQKMAAILGFSLIE